MKINKTFYSMVNMKINIAIPKVSPTDHSYDGLDNSSQGSTALAQVINNRKRLLKSHR